MKKLVTISRQYGSGGRTIGKLLADILHVPFYDKEIIDMAVEESGYSREVIEGAEMKAKSGFAYSLSSALSFTEGAGGINKDLSVNDIMRAYAMFERGMMYDWCLAGGNYSLTQYSQQILPLFLQGLCR